MVGKIYDLRSGQFVGSATVALRLAQSRFVYLGEKHDNADHHRLQAWALSEIAASGRKPRVVFEMLDPTQQAEVDRYAERSPTALDGFAEAVGWSASGWPEFSFYRPVFAAALSAGLPIVGGGLPRAEAMALSKGERSLPEELRARHGLDQPLPAELQAALKHELVEGHCGQLPDRMIQPMIKVQRARDARMADAMLDPPTDGAVLVGGVGHARPDRGVPWYVRRHDDATALSIEFQEVSKDATAPTEYLDPDGGASPFDLIWFTPRALDVDYCAELEETMKRIRAHRAKS